MNRTKILQPETRPPGDLTALLEEFRQEYWASPELTEEQKRYLDALATLPEEEWEPIEYTGRPISETAIEDRGPR